ncbi:MAG: LTA synthase family protein [Bacteroidales bacterium]|nr:LTA synthase family protein [Bacteroidales bacterium]
MVAISGLYFLGMRGNLGVVRLDDRHAIISENVFVNSLPVNGLFSTKIAWADRKASRIDTNITKMLKSLKFRSIEEAASVLYTTRIDSVTPETFYTYTSENDFLENNPPHVVFILMESMSNFYIDMHSDSCNLLGTLADVLDSCYLFRNFLPSSSGTIYSLESILVNTPKSPLSQSPSQNYTFNTSAAKPFFEKGYTNIFLTGGKMGWRNMDKFIPRQYFMSIEAEPTLRKLYPDGKAGEWGMHDEVLFQRAFDLLKNSNGKPYLVFGMTISHHTPYDIPAYYKGYPVSIPEWARKRMKFNDEVVLKGLRAYQYASSCLGDFIKQIISSPLGENTIIVATGDHNIRQNFEYPQADLFMQYSVPLLIYIPPKYRPKNSINTKRFASHKDIFPTLYSLSLSNARYPNFGNNLCDPKSTSDFGLYCYSIAADSLGLVDFSSSPLFYRWCDREHRKLVPSNASPDPHLDSLMIRARALTACMNYLLIKDVEKKR